MNILVIGSGGREHALVWKLAQSPRVKAIWCAPGNPGIAAQAKTVPIQATDIEGLYSFAVREHIDLTVVGPEQPLADGIVDRFRREGLPIFGPTRAAAELEWSKSFAKDFMARHAIPTAEYRVFTDGEEQTAVSYLDAIRYPVVLKADGLAAGKGVMICADRTEAVAILGDVIGRKKFGAAGSRIVIEEFMEGEEASVFAICDGSSHILLASAQDHKRVFDGDRGKNTGGMGAYAPAPVMTGALLDEVERRIIIPTLRGMASEGKPYTGCLYVGLMITAAGPKVVEYNARFGDPETQVVLPLFEGDLAEILRNAAMGSLPGEGARQWKGAAACVVLASGGYPDTYQNGFAIEGLPSLTEMKNVVAFHAGTVEKDGVVRTAGGRVLGVTAMDPGGDLRSAIDRAYAGVRAVTFSGMHFRTDIGQKGLARLQS